MDETKLKKCIFQMCHSHFEIIEHKINTKDTTGKWLKMIQLPSYGMHKI